MFTNNPYTERSSVEIGFYPNENCEIRSCCFAYKKVLAAIWKANCQPVPCGFFFSSFTERVFVNIMELAQKTVSHSFISLPHVQMQFLYGTLGCLCTLHTGQLKPNTNIWCNKTKTVLFVLIASAIHFRTRRCLCFGDSLESENLHKVFYNHLYPDKEFFILTSNAMDIPKNGTEIAYKEDTRIGFSLILC